MDFLVSLDQSLFLLLNGLHAPVLDAFFPFITDFGNFKIPLVLGVLFVLWKGNGRHRTILLLLALAVGCADMTGAILKDAVGRDRPFWSLEGARLLAGKSGSGSFPSNHAANCFALAGFLFWEFRRRKVVTALLFFFAALVAYSRVYVGVHYPVDVLAGAMLGFGISSAVWWMDRRDPLLAPNERGRWRLNFQTVALFLLALVTLYRLTLIFDSGAWLAAEEAQYWEWSRRLDWSYYSKPPFIAWTIWLGTHLFGHTVAGIRFGAVALSLILAVVSLFFCRDLSPSRKGLFWSIFFLGLMPLFAVGAIVMTTDTPLLVFWGLSLYAYYRAIFHDNASGWWLGGAAMGLGLLSKYAMIYLPFCLIVFLILTPEKRALLKRKSLWLSFLFAAVFFTPVIYWNAQHDFVAFLHVEGQALGKEEGIAFTPLRFLEFLGSQFGVVSPLFFGGLLTAYWGVWQRRREMPALFYLLCASAPVLGLILLKSLFGKAQANWAAPAYYSGTLLTVYYLLQVYEEGSAHRKKMLQRFTLAGAALALLITGYIYDPVVIREEAPREMLKKIGVSNPYKLDPMWQFVGLNKVAREAQRMREKMARPDQVFIGSTEYQTAALMAFYLEDQPITYCIPFSRRQNQYDLWPGPQDKKGWDAIMVSRKRGKWEKYHDRFRKSFARSGETRLYTIRVDDQKYQTYALTPYYDFQGTIAKRDTFDTH